MGSGLHLGWFALMALNFADVWTTNAILRQGGYERSPVMRKAMGLFGTLWPVPKIGIVAAAAYYAPGSALEIPALAALLIFYGWVVWHNLGEMRG